jgi:type II secretion system (T2SS) protein E
VSSSDHVPPSRDGAPNWAADTDPVGPVTPELALVDPGLASGGHLNSEVSMSSMQFGDGSLGAPEPAPAALNGEQAPPLQPLPSLAPAPPAPAPEATPPVPADPAPSMAVADMRDVPLGTLVFRAGLLPEEKLEEALQEGMKSGKRLGEVLLERGLVSENDLGRLLAGQKGLPFVELDPAAIDPTAPPLLHPEKARLHGALPIGFQNGVPVVAVADPSNDLVIENVRRALNCEPSLVVAGRDALHSTIDAVYGGSTPPAAPVVEPEAPAPEPVAAAPVVPEPEPVQPVVPEPVPVAEAPPAVLPEPEPGLQPEPVLQPEPIAVEPLAVEPLAVEPVAPEPLAVEPLVVEPVIQPESLAVEPIATPEPQEPAPVPVVDPIAIQPTQNGDGLWLGQVDQAPPAQIVPEHQEPVAPEPEPVQIVEPIQTVEPVLSVEPVLPAEPEPVLLPEPEVAAPVAEPVAVDQALEQPVEQPCSVELRLANGERIEMGAYSSEEEAVEGARQLVAQASVEGTWPFVGDRFIRPDAIVSVDLVRQDGARWLGSSARAAAWAQKPAEQ